MQTAVHSRDGIGWVVAKEIGHWNLPSTSAINKILTPARSVGFSRRDGWRPNLINCRVKWPVFNSYRVSLRVQSTDSVTTGFDALRLKSGEGSSGWGVWKLRSREVEGAVLDLNLGRVGLQTFSRKREPPWALAKLITRCSRRCPFCRRPTCR